MASKGRTFLRVCAAWLVYGLSFLAPRNPRLWVFYGWHRSGTKEHFADNSKYFFLYASIQKSEGVRAVWLSPDPHLVEELRARGYEAYTENSWEGISFALRAGYTFIDAQIKLFNWQFVGRSKVIQLWHGVPTKKIMFQTLTSYPSRFFSPNWWLTPYRYISTSPWYTDVTAEAFRHSADTFVTTGYPRNDRLFKEIAASELGAAELPPLIKDHRGRVFLYAPTFRPDGSNPLAHLDLEKFFSFLEQSDSMLCISLHPKLSKHTPTWRDAFAKRIHFIGGGSDVYPILEAFDACITDYSSTATDFLLTGKPVLYYQYDFEEYAHSTGFQDNVEELLPGPRARTFDDLMFALTQMKEEDLFVQARERTLQKAFTQRDGKSSERLFTFLRQDMQK